MTKNSIMRTIAAVCSVTFLAIVGYAQDKPIKKDLKFTIIPKNINNPYMVIQSGGAMDACKELGIEGKVVGPSEAGASAQVPYINTAMTQRQNAILIAANDPNALVPYLKKAMGQKISVVTLDSDTAPEGRRIFINQASAEGIGQSLVQTLAKEIGSGGDFAILSATPNATNQNTWIKYMQEELKKPEYKDMKLVKIAYGNDEDQKSFTETKGCFKRIPTSKASSAPQASGLRRLRATSPPAPTKARLLSPGWEHQTNYASLSRTAQSRNLNCGAPQMSVTWPLTPPRNSLPATSRARRVRRSRPASWVLARSAKME